MTETTKTIEERVAALETKTTTLSTDVSNATTVANRAAGSATTATSTANTAKANAGTAQAAADTAAAAAAAARKIAEDASLTAEDAFGETADNLKAIEEDVRPALKNLQNKDAALQTAIDAIPDVSSDITALKAADVTLQSNIDAIPDVSAEITALKAADVTLQSNIDAIPDVSSQIAVLAAKDVELQAAIDDIPTAPAEILPIPVGEIVEITGVGENDYYTFRNIVPGQYKATFTLDPFDKVELGIAENVDITPRFEIEDKYDEVNRYRQRNGIYMNGTPSDGTEESSVSLTFNVLGGHPANWLPPREGGLPQRGAGYLQIRPYVTFHPLSKEEGDTSAQKKLTWKLSLARIS